MANAEEGDASQAWSKLFDRYQQRIQKAIRHLYSPSRAHVEDLLQDVAIRLFERARSYDVMQPAGPWVMRVAKNLVLDWLKSHGNQRVVHVDDDETMELLLHENVSGHQPPRQPVVPQQVIDACRSRHWRAFVRSNPRAAEALYHACIEGWSMAELAVFLDVQVDSAKVFMHRARAAASAALMPCEPDREPQ